MIAYHYDTYLLYKAADADADGVVDAAEAAEAAKRMSVKNSHGECECTDAAAGDNATLVMPLAGAHDAADGMPPDSDGRTASFAVVPVDAAPLADQAEIAQ